MEVLSKFIGRAVQEGLLKGWEVEGRGGGGVVSHLLFADDTLIFCNDSAEDLAYLKAILICFEGISGLKVNMQKSELIPIGEIDNVESKAEVLGCIVGKLPTSYLGLPLGAKFKSVRAWDPVVERFGKRLAGWKGRYLSKGGRLTLIKSTLSNLPIYLMSLFVIPVSVSKKLESIMRRFL